MVKYPEADLRGKARGHFSPQQTTNVILADNQSGDGGGEAGTQRVGQPQNVRDWSNGLCGCCTDCEAFFYCIFCYSCFTCSAASKKNECALGPLCIPGFVPAMRSKLRGQLGIRGSICCDIMVVSCCAPCAVSQMYREVRRSNVLNVTCPNFGY
ncbi:hypothetical protein HELRODRAFT_168983 [Helobdella robusta]|uniref:Uncharacterized protein n=1 Tax=Helobdella robusta TaxID=6412 RepID=T1F180_HELRO|nr:hypothetical protein HELRODRAFT_168983 [Helobdella robusta]ESO09049.1 hypothetical protein HELRODRAFT_168983 [Helobdella robusta]